MNFPCPGRARKRTASTPNREIAAARSIDLAVNLRVRKIRRANLRQDFHRFEIDQQRGGVHDPRSRFVAM